MRMILEIENKRKTPNLSEETRDIVRQAPDDVHLYREGHKRWSRTSQDSAWVVHRESVVDGGGTSDTRSEPRLEI
jgi:hypothetical protein